MNDLNSIDNDWMNFVQGNYNTNILNINKDLNNQTNTNTNNNNNETGDKITAPKSSDLYISTKTQISYLSTHVDLKEYFWKMPVIPYYSEKEGIIKKQMKFNSQNKEELKDITANIQEYKNKNIYVDEYIITNIDNPDGRVKFKDVRKISIGINKKDLISYRCKKKSAFYNCFVVIIRIKMDKIFKDFHVKVFNTGKLEIPGIQHNSSLSKILDILVNTLNSLNIINEKITYNNDSETVLINSNFNCGYLINRDKLYDLLKNKYNINSSYDPCSYPGIQCNFFYDIRLDKQTGIQPMVDKSKDKKTIAKENKAITNENKRIFKVSFMIFRTGSVLVVGRCDDIMINDIYLFIKDILSNEYDNINVNNEITYIDKQTKKNRVCKKKKLKINTNYFNNNVNISG
jgi:hypothetical protein